MTEPLSKRALVGEPQHPATISEAVTAQWPCSNLTIGGGVAIFHVASARVVVCYHTRGKYWFLPKGRRDAHEHSEQAAEREGYEEVRICEISLYRTVCRKATYSKTRTSL